MDGGSNTAVGVAALRDNVSGINNRALGRGALRFNEGNDNIGHRPRSRHHSTLTGQYNNTIFSAPWRCHALDPNDRAYIGNVREWQSGTSMVYQSSSTPAASSARSTLRAGLRKTLNRWTNQRSHPGAQTGHVSLQGRDTKKAEDTPQFGLMAEDVAEVNPDLVVRDDDGEPLTVRYEAVNAMLLNEFLKEHKKVEEQQASITQRSWKSTCRAAAERMEVLTAQLKEQAAQIQKVSAQLELSKPAPKTVGND